MTKWFGDSVGIACRLPRAVREYKSYTGKRRARSRGVLEWMCDIVTDGSKAEHLMLREIRIDAEALLKRAHGAYAEAVNQCGSGDLNLSAA